MNLEKKYWLNLFVTFFFIILFVILSDVLNKDLFYSKRMTVIIAAFFWLRTFYCLWIWKIKKRIWTH